MDRGKERPRRLPAIFARSAWASLVHLEVPAIHHAVVELLNGGTSLVIRHLDEPEATGTARITIRDDRYRIHCSVRLEHLAMEPIIEARPRVAAWLARVKARPSYAIAIGAWAPAPLVEMFHGQGEAVSADVEPLTRR